MFENILHQDVTAQLACDIKAKTFPNSVLLSGPPLSGKLTTALETARVLSCLATGEWRCTCPSCQRVKSLVSQSIMLLGPRDCSLEIAAAKDAFLLSLLPASSNEERAQSAARHLFLRAVRKLTMRFNPILWDGDANLSKVSALTSSIDELMETIDFPAPLPPADVVEKTVNKIEDACQKLESSFLYDTIPVRHVRNVSFWSRLKAVSGKRVVIIEAVDLMLEGVRNSLLKILEEPPADTVFILTTSRRAAVMPTILSRVRTYTLRERTPSQQEEVLSRVFHAKASVPPNPMTIGDYLNAFLPIHPDTVREEARKYIGCVVSPSFPDMAQVAKSCASFKPRVLLTVFMDEVAKCLLPHGSTATESEAAAESFKAVRECTSSIVTYNISPAAALERLFVTLLRINRSYEGCFSSLQN